MQRNARLGPIGAAFGLAVLAGGCRTLPSMIPEQRSVPAAVSIGYSYRAGLASQSFPESEPKVAEAAGAALEDLAVANLKTTARGGNGTFVDGRAADGRRVRLILMPRDGQTTAMVQVGLFGDEPLSRAVLDRIGIRLGTRAPEPVPDVLPSDPESNPFVDREAVPDSVMYRGMTDSGYRDSPVP